MNKKEIIVFTMGDSAKMSTWSNVPCLCTEALIQGGGYFLNRINMDIVNSHLSIKILSKICNLWMRIYKKCFRRKSDFTFSRSWLYQYFVEYYMTREAEKYPLAAAQLVFGFHFRLKHLPALMLGDWTYEYLLEKHTMHSPGIFEMKYIQRENKTILGAEAVVSLFPASGHYMEQRLGRQVYCFGCPVNAAYDYNTMQKKRAAAKEHQSNRVLFIGKRKYIKGLKTLLVAVNQYKEEFGEDIIVDVIGMTGEEFRRECPFVPYSCAAFYGYLDKGDEVQREQYYEMFSRARALINTTANWNGASSLVEGLYYGIPIIISKNPDLERLTDGEQTFVGYCEAENASSLKKGLVNILRMCEQEYNAISDSAHKFAEAYSYESYGAMLSLLLEEMVED